MGAVVSGGNFGRARRRLGELQGVVAPLLAMTMAENRPDFTVL